MAVHLPEPWDVLPSHSLASEGEGALKIALRVVAETSANIIKIRPIELDLDDGRIGEPLQPLKGDLPRLLQVVLWAPHDQPMYTQEIIILLKLSRILAPSISVIRAADYRNAWSKDATKLEEYDYFLRIHGLIMRGPKDDLEQARQVAFEGLKRFPDSAIIKIKLAWTYLNDVRRGFSDDPRRDLERAFALGSEGMAGKDIPRLGQMHGHWLMALAYFYCKQDYSRALDEREITLAMAPIDAIVYVDLSQTLTFAGRPMEALNSIHKAIELDPGYPPWFHTYLAEAYYAAGKSREAVDELAKINQPAFRDLVYGAASHASLGQLEE